MFGICNLSIVPCRKEPSDRSEMVTQLLFGEHFEVLEVAGNWCRIRLDFDHYECWIDKKQFLPVAEQTAGLLSSSAIFCSSELVQVVTDNRSKLLFPILLGSTLPNLDNGDCTVENNSYSYDGAFIQGRLPFTKSGLIELAMLYLNAPYIWGGRSPFGIDCSGFTQMVYKLNGVRLLRDAYQQAEQGETLSFVEEAEPGDLAFFDNEEGRIVHVGIVLENNRIIHASGKVRIDGFDHHGIFNAERKDYSHQLRLLKRIV